MRRARQAELAERAEQLLHGAFQQQLLHLRQSTLQRLSADMAGRDPLDTFAASAARYWVHLAAVVCAVTCTWLQGSMCILHCLFNCKSRECLMHARGGS